MEKEILRLTQFWYDYISPGHHKDRDCHFYINEVWSYGELPKYRVEHYGYIAHEIEPVECDTHEESEKALLKMLREIIAKEKEWARRVLKDKTEWDSEQIASAKKVNDFI